VSYTPEEAGSLTIYLSAFNTLHRQNITKHIMVQNLIIKVVLIALPNDTFINKTVTLMASITPTSNALSANSVHCSWEFGDESDPLLTNSTTVGYKYSQSGQFLVTVSFLSSSFAHFDISNS